MNTKSRWLLCLLAFSLSAPALAKDPAPAPAPNAKPGFQSADKNGDGKLSREEHMEASRRAAERFFDRLDQNKDGFITKEEAAAGRKKPTRPQPQQAPKKEGQKPAAPQAAPAAPKKEAAPK